MVGTYRIHITPHVKAHVTATYYADPNWDETVTERTRIYLVATLGVKICSIRVPSLLVWWRHTSIIPIKSAIMLCYDGQIRNGSVATHFFQFSSTATSSATSEYVTILERPSRNEQPTTRNEEQTGNIQGSYLVLPQNLFNEITCIRPVREHEILNYSAHLFFLHCN